MYLAVSYTKRIIRPFNPIILFCFCWLVHSCNSISEKNIPVLTTTPISRVTQTTALSGGTVIADNGMTVIRRGVCWSTHDTPKIEDDTTVNGAGVGEYESILGGLELNTTYFLRAYATNADGTGYGMAISFTTKATFSVGDEYLGGKIAYIFKPGDSGYEVSEAHGLIVATVDQSTSIGWLANNSVVGADGIEIGTGNANTLSIVNTPGSGACAAKLCFDLVLDGYSDWYLPSKRELEEICANKDIIGGFSEAGYWTSSENLINNWAWYRGFESCGDGMATKNWQHHVRAIRSF